ncbi:hypothetical protein GRS96_07265 [Rathayibacter sp. VKM Ac-2803]|uniref:DUF6907 domain-containing protein n=1 Tax=unclassified Rathayibacter TaxID=2609250 RepID=UPI001357CE40|nr:MULTISPECIES: hypothetical protein [unclassified Rathayibacter]MWV49075.1 hypothetical protein [Rathayibacter sp. VKM Ac-2803]MWV58431.1 hypothetical protein [Rathayibacter sp. VKM Ac-2754]
MDGFKDDGRGDGCPRWCEREHDELSETQERLHRSAARSLPVVLWPRAGEEPSAVTAHVSLCRPGSAGEDRLRVEADGLGTVDLDLSSAARLARGVESTLALLGHAS